MKIAQGFTLIEAMVVIAIIAVFACLGVPAFQNFVQKQKIESSRKELIALAHMARMTAVTEGGPTVVCGSLDGDACDRGSVWQGNVIAFRDANFNHARDEGEALIFSQSLGNANVRGTRSLLEFNPSGAGYMGSWLYCSPDIAQPQQTFRLVVSLGGRIRSEATDLHRCS